MDTSFNMNNALLRWLLFIFVGLPVQVLVYVLYPLLYAYWRLRIFEDFGEKDKKISDHVWHDPVLGNKRRAPFNYFLDNPDDHNTFCMYGNIKYEGYTQLMVNGNPVRRVNEDGSLNRWQVSGDVVISWCFSYLDPGITPKPSKMLLLFAKTYLKNLGVQSYDEKNNGHVSSRCNNFGVNYCPDSDAKGIGQPMAGPQFYTNSCLFALASRESFIWKIVFWTHWILLGGWYWCWWPVIHTKERRLDYVRDMTMRALYIHKVVFGNRWWIRIPMNFICYRMSEYRNDFWYAMMGQDPINPIPQSMDGFFPQQPDATSRVSDRMNGNFGPAIFELAKQARSIK